MKSLLKIRFYIYTTLALFLGVFVINVTLADTIIPGDIDTSLQVIKRLLITTDGSPMGNPVADLNSGGNIIFYPTIHDSNGNPYISNESDPVFSSSSAAGISATQITHWNTAYSRGNHSTMGYLTSESDPLWFLEKPNYYTKIEVDNLISSTVGGLRYKGIWDYSTGALPSDVSLGYFYKISTEGNYNGLHLLTGDMIIANEDISGETNGDNWDVISNTVSETDPVFSSSVVAGIGSLDITHWNDAYSRGNHILMGYLTGESDPIWILEKDNYYTKEQISSKGYLTGEIDPQWNTDKSDYYTKNDINTKGYLTSFSESDPEWNSASGDYYTKVSIDEKFNELSGTVGGISNESDPIWSANSGDYYTKSDIDAKGFLTNFNELDPLFSASAAAGITSTNISHWNDAYSRGNHTLMGYLTGYNENDPLWNSASGDYYTKSAIDIKGFLTSFSELDPLWNASSGDYYTKSAIDTKGFLTSFSELDPLWNSASGDYYTKSDIDAKNFLTSFTELDPQWNSASGDYYTKSAIDAKGFLTSFSELDPLWNSASGDYYTKSAIDAKGYLTGQVWNQSGTTINYMSGNVGIGTSSPVGKLQVAGSSTYNSDTVKAFRVSDGTTLTKAVDIGYDVTLDRGFIQAGNFGVQYRDLLLNPNQGNVGIGTTTPSSKLDVNGLLRATQFKSSTNGISDTVFYNTDIVNPSASIYARYFHGGVTFTDATVSRYIGLNANAAWKGRFIEFDLNNTRKFSVNDIGETYIAENLGIGTTSPSEKLEVAGNIKIPSTGSFLIGTNAITDTTLNNWNDAYSRGNHSAMGYLTGFTELDPQWNSASGDYYTKSAIDAKGFLTSFSELDPLWNSASGDYYTKSTIDNKGFLTGEIWSQSGSSINYLSGNVGIGTDNPDSKLQVNGSVKINATSGDRYTQFSQGQFSGDPLSLSFGGTGISSYLDIIQSHPMYGFLMHKSGYWGGQGIQTDGTLGISHGSNTKDIAFYSQNFGGETMRIKGNGNVGIGTTAPNTKLEINGKASIGDSITNTRLNANFGPRSFNLIDTNAAVRIWRYDSSAGNAAQIELGIGNNDTFFNNDVWGIGSFYQDGFSIYKRNGTDYRYFNINSGGNIGIGTTNPVAKFTIKQHDQEYAQVNLPGTFDMALGIAANTALIGGMDFKNFNGAGQVRLMARNDRDDYIVMNTFGSTAAGTVFGINRTNTHAIFGQGTTDTTKKLAIGTFNNGDLVLGTNNTERMRILAGGNVGIGTTSPASLLNGISGVSEFRWSVGASSVTPTISVINNNAGGKAAALLAGSQGSSFEYDAAGFFDISSNAKSAFTGNTNGVGGTSRMRILANGNMGIGTITPGTKLDIVASDTINAPITVTNYGNAGAILGRRANGTIASPTALVADNMISATLARGYNGSGFTTSSNGGFYIYAGENWTTNANGTYLTFDTTANGGTSRTEKMRIDTNGNVGIGTSAPIAKLDIGDTILAGSGGLNGSILNLTQTWNTTGGPSAIKLNVINTASSSASKLIDLQVGGASKFYVDKAGNLITLNLGVGLQGKVGISPGGFYNLSTNSLNQYQAAGAIDVSIGSTVYNGFHYLTTINQTGTANGITRGVYINPSITNAADFRAIELTNNIGKGIWQIGTAINSLAGMLGIGTITPSSKLDVVGDIELPSTGSVLLGEPDTEGTRRITTSGGALSFQVYHGSAWEEKSTIAP